MARSLPDCSAGGRRWAARRPSCADVRGAAAARCGSDQRVRFDDERLPDRAQQAFDDGLAFFRRDQFDEARQALDQADPAGRDSLTQFYIACTSITRLGTGVQRQHGVQSGLAAV